MAKDNSNPNQYDNDAYTEASTELHHAMEGLWKAGANVQNLVMEIQSALDFDADVRRRIQVYSQAHSR